MGFVGFCLGFAGRGQVTGGGRALCLQVRASGRYLSSQSAMTGSPENAAVAVAGSCCCNLPRAAQHFFFGIGCCESGVGGAGVAACRNDAAVEKRRFVFFGNRS